MPRGGPNHIRIPPIRSKQKRVITGLWGRRPGSERHAIHSGVLYWPSFGGSAPKPPGFIALGRQQAVRRQTCRPCRPTAALRCTPCPCGRGAPLRFDPATVPQAADACSSTAPDASDAPPAPRAAVGVLLSLLSAPCAKSRGSGGRPPAPGKRPGGDKTSAQTLRSHSGRATHNPASPMHYLFASVLVWLYNTTVDGCAAVFYYADRLLQDAT